MSLKLPPVTGSGGSGDALPPLAPAGSSSLAHASPAAAGTYAADPAAINDLVTPRRVSPPESVAAAQSATSSHVASAAAAAASASSAAAAIRARALPHDYSSAPTVSAANAISPPDPRFAAEAAALAAAAAAAGGPYAISPPMNLSAPAAAAAAPDTSAAAVGAGLSRPGSAASGAHRQLFPAPAQSHSITGVLATHAQTTHSAACAGPHGGPVIPASDPSLGLGFGVTPSTGAGAGSVNTSVTAVEHVDVGQVDALLRRLSHPMLPLPPPAAVAAALATTPVPAMSAQGDKAGAASAAYQGQLLSQLLPASLDLPRLLLHCHQLQADYATLHALAHRLQTSGRNDVAALLTEIDKLERARAAAAAAAERGATAAAAATARAAAAERDAAGLRAGANTVKDRLLASLAVESLEVDDVQFARLAARAPESLSLLERVQTQLWQAVARHRSHAAGAAGAVRELSERAQSLTAQTEVQARDLADARQTQARLLQQLASERATHEAEHAALETEAVSLRHKGRRFDLVSARAAELEAEVARLKGSSDAAAATAKESSAATQAATEEARRAREEMGHAQQEAALLRADKEHLLREAILLREQLRTAESELARSRDKAAALKRNKEELGEQLLRAQVDARLQYESRLDGELARLRERSEAALSEVRAQQTEVHHRELAALKQSKDEGWAQLARAQSELSELRRAREETEDRLRHDKATAEAQAADALTQLRVKAAEAERVAGLYEKAHNDYQAMRVLHDAAKERADVILAEYHAVREATAKLEAESRATEQALRGRLQAYAVLEHDLDLAIVRAGADTAAAFDNASGAGRAGKHPGERVLWSGGGSGPGAAGATSASAHKIHGVDAVLGALASGGSDMTAATGAARQRLRQSLLLAHRLTEKQAEIARLTQELAQSRAAGEKQAAELAAIHAAAARAGRRDSLLALLSADAARAGFGGSAMAAVAGADAALFPPGPGARMDFAATSAFPALTLQQQQAGQPAVAGQSEQQPYAFLTESLRAQSEELRGREAVVEALRTRVAVLESQLEAERARAGELSAAFGKDLRRLAAQQRQVHVLRELVAGLLKQYGGVMSRSDIDAVAETIKSMGRDASAAAGGDAGADIDVARSKSEKNGDKARKTEKDSATKAAELIKRALAKAAR